MAETLFVVRRMREEYRNKKKKLYIYMCFVDIEKAFDKSSKKGEAMGKKGLPEVIVRVVMSLYHGAKSKV